MIHNCSVRSHATSAVWILLSEEGGFVIVRAGGGLSLFPRARRGVDSTFLLEEMSGLGFPPAETESSLKEIVPAYYFLFFHGDLDQGMDFVCFS